MSSLWPTVGQIITETRRFSQAEFDRFAALSGDDNPIHVDATFAATTRFGRPVAHGMLLYSAICATLNRHFPAPCNLTRASSSPAPTYAEETMTIRIEVIDHSTASTCRAAAANDQSVRCAHLPGRDWLAQECPMTLVTLEHAGPVATITLNRPGTP